MAMECPACGGHLVFKPGSQKLECPYCESVFDAETYSQRNEAEKHSVQEDECEQITVDVYHCKHCGAELCAPEEQVVSFCMYCGGQATLLKKASTMQRPVGVIPFKIDKNSVCKKYAEALSGIPFVPSDFKKAKFLEGFRGIYIPYWKNSVPMENLEAQLSGVVREVGYRVETKSYFDYKAQFSGSVDVGTYDASEAFDDVIASAISPYKRSSIVPFNESYLSGFYADKATVEPGVYGNAVQDLYEETLQKEISAQLGGLSTSTSSIQEKLPMGKVKSESCLFPVWFLTWRNKNRVSYSVMNGESGVVCAEVPVDFKKFFVVAAIVATILSFIMCSIPTFVIPFRVAAYSSILLFLSSYIFRNELKCINQIENHTFDYGSALHKKDKTAEFARQRRKMQEKARDQDSGYDLNVYRDVMHEIGRNDLGGALNQLDQVRSNLSVQNLSSSNGCLGTGLSALMIVFLLGSIWFASHIRLSDDVFKFFVLMGVLQVVMCVKQFSQLSGIAKKSGIFTIILSIMVQFAGLIVIGTGTQDDIYYYGITVGCLAAMIINIITSVFYTDYLATRPVPNFFKREGAKNGR